MHFPAVRLEKKFLRWLYSRLEIVQRMFWRCWLPTAIHQVDATSDISVQAIRRALPHRLSSRSHKALHSRCYSDVSQVAALPIVYHPVSSTRTRRCVSAPPCHQRTNFVLCFRPTASRSFHQITGSQWSGHMRLLPLSKCSAQNTKVNRLLSGRFQEST